MKTYFIGTEQDIVQGGNGIIEDQTYFNPNYSRVAIDCTLAKPIIISLAEVFNASTITDTDFLYEPFWLKFTIKMGFTQANKLWNGIIIYERDWPVIEKDSVFILKSVEYNKIGIDGYTIIADTQSSSHLDVEALIPLLDSNLHTVSIGFTGQRYGNCFIYLDDILIYQKETYGAHWAFGHSIEIYGAQEELDGILVDVKTGISEIIVSDFPLQGKHVKTLSAIDYGSKKDLVGTVESISEKGLDTLGVSASTFPAISTFIKENIVESNIYALSIATKLGINLPNNLFKTVLKLGDNEVYVPVQHDLISDNASVFKIFDKNPITNLPFTKDDINTLEFGAMFAEEIPEPLIFTVFIEDYDQQFTYPIRPIEQPKALVNIYLEHNISVNDSEFVYRTIELDEGDYTINVTETSGDPDLYISLSQLPTRSIYDYSSTNGGPDTVTIRLQQPSTVNIGIYGWDATITLLRVDALVVIEGSSPIVSFSIDWGDGTENLIEDSFSHLLKHSYASPGTYDITVLGRNCVPCCGLNDTYLYDLLPDNTYYDEASKIIGIKKFGKIVGTMGNDWSHAFNSCYNLASIAADTQIADNVTVLDYFFAYCDKLNANIDHWDVSNIESMYSMFTSCDIFNTPLNSWDITNCKNITYMFSGTKAFNQDLSNWNIGNKNSLRGLFSSGVYNSSLSLWDVSKVIDISNMFNYNNKFNQQLNSWNTENLVITDYTFSRAIFNQELNSWKMGSVESINGMFYYATYFNKDLYNWDTSNVRESAYAFSYSVFNKEINSWNVKKIANMSYMFYKNTKFNLPLNMWETNSLKNTSGMFYYSYFNQELNTWNMSNVTNINQMFSNAYYFNRELSNWDVSNCNGFSQTFDNAVRFDYNISCWNVTHITYEPYYFGRSSPFYSRDSNSDGIYEFRPKWGQAPNPTCMMYNYRVKIIDSVTKLPIQNVYCIKNNIYRFTDADGMILFLDQPEATLKFSAVLYDYYPRVLRIAYVDDNIYTVELALTDIVRPFIYKILPYQKAYDIKVRLSQEVALLIDWGNGVISGYDNFTNELIGIGYLDDKLKTIKIYGMSPAPYFARPDSVNRLQDIVSWGYIVGATDWSYSFAGSQSLSSVSARDSIGSNVTNISHMFDGASKFNGHIENWRTPQITNMEGTFKNATTFNRMLICWEVMQIPSKPLDFSTNCPLLPEYHPYWGQDHDATCHGGISNTITEYSVVVAEPALRENAYIVNAIKLYVVVAE